MMRFGFAIVLWTLCACASAPGPGVSGPPEALARGAPAWLAQHDVPSVAIAFIGEGRVSWVAAYGERAPGEAATADSLYNVASLAKPVSAEVMLRAVSAGRAALDEPISPYWVDPDIAADPRRDALTLRLALSHRTGFPNWRYQTDNVLRFRNEPGAAFTYSGEGFEYARRYIEARAGEPFEAMAARTLLAPSGMTRTAFTRRPWFEDAIALPHDGDGAPLAPSIRNAPNAADDLYTTAGDYARFVLAVMNGEGLSPELARARFEYELELRDGGCGDGEGLLPPAACPQGVGMGLGWMVFRYEGETIISHTGSDEGEQAIAFFVPERRLGVVILTNSAHGARLYPEIVAALYPHEKFIAFLRMQAAR